MMEEGKQLVMSDSIAGTTVLPRLDFIELKRQYSKVTRTQSNAARETQAPKLATTGDTDIGIFEVSKASVRLMLYSVTAQHNRGTMSCVYAPNVRWANLNLGSGEVGALAEFTLDLNLREDEFSKVYRIYEHDFPVQSR